MGRITAMVGVDGLRTYSVRRRTREIGVRMAIGADRPSVIAMVLKEGLLLGGVGVAIGLILSVLACRVLISKMWMTSFNDVNYALFGAIALPLLFITVLASYPPAHRASLVD